VFASLSLIRHLLAWAAALVVAGMVWSGIFSGMNDGPGWIFGLLAMFLMISALGSAITHVRRVWLVAGRLDADHPVRPPAPPGRTADGCRPRLLGGGSGDRRTAARRRRGKLGRQPAGARLCAPRRPWNGRQPSRWNLPARLAIKRNSVLATVTPGQGTSTVTLLFEPMPAGGPTCWRWTRAATSRTPKRSPARSAAASPTSAATSRPRPNRPRWKRNCRWRA
jgi:hypothetical protein